MPDNDTNTLNRIVNDLDANLMIEAGAGTGKTYALVSRVVALVKSGVRMQEIVAITFTVAAAAELSERIRSRLEQLADKDHPDNTSDILAEDLDEDSRERIKLAIEELDQATIQTIHGFASQLLREHPLDAGLPPGWIALDEVEASRLFAEHWDKWLDDTLAENTSVEPEVICALRYLLNSEVGAAKWRAVADALKDNCARLADKSVFEKLDLPELAHDTLRKLKELAAECKNPSDKLYGQLQGAIATVESVLAVADDVPAAAEVLRNGERVDYYRNVGSGANWQISTAEVRAEFRAIGQKFTATVYAALLLPFLHNLRQFALDYEQERKSGGVATFEDLLAWSRDLLRGDKSVREHLQSRYTRILIDEFQDTDPLQVEIAYYLAADPNAELDRHAWYELPLSPGRLFVVGDPKQSIYRFRGADLGVAELVERGGQLQKLTITKNRRSQKAIIDWVNAVFGANSLMTENAGIQAEYIDLERHDDIQQEEIGAAVRLFGEQKELNADTVRRLQARHVAGLIVRYATGGESGLDVYDKKLKSVRKAKLGDICILVRSRTGIEILTQTLEDSRIPYRLEGGSLLFDTQEVRDMLNCLKAIDDPYDEVAVVASLRSAAFACSDVELLDWRESGCGWNYTRQIPDDKRLDSPVRKAFDCLRSYHERRLTDGVSKLMADFVRDRRLDELDLAERRPRESWRRRHFLLEQARTMEYSHAVNPHSPPLTLNKFLDWVKMQQNENARISDLVVPDPDDDAVRIMTMHASKGLEFPIVILLGLNQSSNSGSSAVLFDNESSGAEVRFHKEIETPGYAALSDSEKEHEDAEAARLAYVAATRARDHLLVSMYHTNRESSSVIGKVAEFSSALQGQGHCTEEPEDPVGIAMLPTPSTDAVELTDYDAEQWGADRENANRQRIQPRAVTPSWIARIAVTDDATLPVEVEDKDPEPSSEQPSIRGRGGTAFGSALHAVLQEIVDIVSTRTPLPEGVSIDNLLDELDGEIIRSTEEHAESNGVAQSIGEIARLARMALRNPALQAALESPRMWAEVPVAAEIDSLAGPVVIEGIIDLLYQSADGEFVIVDYKSDYIADDVALKAKMKSYRWQGAAYAAAVQKASGQSIKDVQLLFVRRDEAQSIKDLDGLIARLPELLTVPKNV
ncbi:MAG: AAA family ATPase [Chloroflexi bacterium]|nr:AAA family ATPase [Chloroflexota bacterium]